MSILVDKLPIVDYSTVISSGNTVLKNATLIFNNDNFHRQATERLEPFEIIPSIIASDAPIVIYFGQYSTTLRTTLITHLKNADIMLILFSTEDCLWRWLDSNSSLTVASVILEGNNLNQRLISRLHACDTVRSILIRCSTSELTSLQRFSRSYARVDGVFEDDIRLIFKLLLDLALFSEELADYLREDQGDEIGALRSYDRALKLCALVRKF